MIICLTLKDQVIDANTIYITPPFLGVYGTEYCIKYQFNQRCGTVFKSSNLQEVETKFNTFKSSIVKGDAIYSEYD